MTNYGALAILAELSTHGSRLRTARAYSLLIALETFPPGADGWREVGADELCMAAGLTRKSYRRARGELADAKLIEYRLATRRGENSRWRITFPVDGPPSTKGRRKGDTPGPERGIHPDGAVTPSPEPLTSQDVPEGGTLCTPIPAGRLL